MTQSPHVGGEDIETKSSELRQRVQNSPQFHNEVDRIIAELKKAITKGKRSNKAAVKSIA